MNLNDALQSRTFRGVLIGLGAALSVSMVFQAGMFAGYHKAARAFRSGENYYRAFEGGPRPPGDMPRGGFPEAHGTVGRVLSVDLPVLIVQGPDGVERAVRLTDATVIRRFRDLVQADALASDQYVVVIGIPDAQGQVEAKFIRLVPPPGR